jgi:hypothetical protein
VGPVKVPSPNKHFVNPLLSALKNNNRSVKPKFFERTDSLGEIMMDV